MTSKELKQMFIVLGMATFLFLGNIGDIRAVPFYKKNNDIKELSWLFDMQCKACDEFVQASFANYERIKAQGKDAVDQYGFLVAQLNQGDFDLITNHQHLEFFKQCAQEVGLDRVPRVYVEKADSQYVTNNRANACASIDTIFLSRKIFNYLQQIETTHFYGQVRQVLLHEMGHIKHHHTVRSLGLGICRLNAGEALANEFYKLELALEQQQGKTVNHDVAVELHSQLDRLREHMLENNLIKLSGKQQLVEDLILKQRQIIDSLAKAKRSVSLKYSANIWTDIINIAEKVKGVWDLAEKLHNENQADFEAYAHLKCYKCAENAAQALMHWGQSRTSRDMAAYWPMRSVKMFATGLKQRGLLCSHHQNQESR